MKNLTGQTINNRLIIGKSDEKSGGHWKWNFKCLNCGIIGLMREIWLRKNNCQCIMSEERPNRVKKMAGNRYGKWTVTNQYETREDTHSYWLCKCDCGEERWVSRPNLIDGSSTSCGMCS